MREDVINAYFDWLYELVCKNRFAKEISFRKLFAYLHSTEFRYFIDKDENRAEDGIMLRRRFYTQTEQNVERYFNGPCSVLEMMIALALRCEQSIMDDPRLGNRTGQWFWRMVTNLGLGAMTDERFDKEYVSEAVERFLNREYEPNGKGGLFTVKHCDHDLREVEIWIQMLWYLDNITGYTTAEEK